jgi:hypothetical protein
MSYYFSVAYGPSCFAVVVEAGVVLMNYDNQVVYFMNSNCRVKSLNTNGDSLSVYLSNGSKVYLYRDPVQEIYQQREPIDFRDVGAPLPVLSMGGSREISTYLSCDKKIVFYFDDSGRHVSMDLPFCITAHYFDGDTNRLLLTTKERTEIYLYSIQLEKPSSCFEEYELKSYKILVEHEEPYEAMAVSKHGDVVLHFDGIFHILNPLKNGETWRISLGDNDYGGESCFSGIDHDYFIFCGEKCVSMHIFKKEDDAWSELNSYGEDQLEAHFKNKWPYEGRGTSVLSAGFNGKHAIVVFVHGEYLNILTVKH